MPVSTSRGSGKRRPTPPPDVMTIDDLATYLQVSKSSLYKLAQDGKVPGQKVGKHWRFRKDTIDNWLDESELGSSESRSSTL
jgi:excisionase family DNA binding protein